MVEGSRGAVTNTPVHRVLVLFRHSALKQPLHFPNPRNAHANLAVTRYRKRLELELADDGAESFQDIGHGQVAANTHAVSHTEGNEEVTPTGFVRVEPPVRSKNVVVLTPNLRVVMKNVIRDTDVCLVARQLLASYWVRIRKLELTPQGTSNPAILAPLGDPTRRHSGIVKTGLMRKFSRTQAMV